MFWCCVAFVGQESQKRVETETKSTLDRHQSNEKTDTYAGERRKTCKTTNAYKSQNKVHGEENQIHNTNEDKGHERRAERPTVSRSVTI